MPTFDSKSDITPGATAGAEAKSNAETVGDTQMSESGSEAKKANNIVYQNDGEEIAEAEVNE